MQVPCIGAYTLSLPASGMLTGCLCIWHEQCWGLLQGGRAQLRWCRILCGPLPGL